MLSFKKYLCSLLCLVLVMAALASCDGKATGEDSTDTEEAISVIGENSFYATLDIEDYVTLCDYKGLTLDISGTDGSREAMEKAISEYLYENSRIEKYPEEPVRYYIEQEKSFYMYLANGDEEQYAALLAEAGVSEEDFDSLAKKYVAKDLILCAITKAEGISVSDAQRAELFDKYVKEYVDSYGYTEEYVKENLTELIYDSMLYDKTMELLIESNTFAN